MHDSYLFEEGGRGVWSRLCESTGEALCTGFEETVEDNVSHTKFPPPKRNQVPGYEINWDPLYAECHRLEARIRGNLPQWE